MSSGGLTVGFEVCLDLLGFVFDSFQFLSFRHFDLSRDVF
jgi:hypothetical protein